MSHRNETAMSLPRILPALLLALSGGVRADSLSIAVAANFAAPAKAIAAAFEQASGHRVELSSGATGKFYAQIRNGAPYAVLLAADTATPEKLEKEGRGIAGTRHTYAIGRLVLWSAKPGLVDGVGQILAGGRFRHLAIANPRLAPYGAAARAVLEGRGLWQAVQGKLVMGENIAQTQQFVLSGNAELGFLALSQIRAPGQDLGGSAWLVPPALYPELKQDAVLLKDEPAARAFLAYLRGPAARDVIAAWGYALP